MRISAAETSGALVARRVLLVLAVAACLALLLAGVARGAEQVRWRYAPAAAPPPPPGVGAAPYGVPLGVVGEISFWAPNRGLLITGGTAESGGGPVPSGIYAYDGVNWHQLASVCGGAEGRIVWAGPDEFWTIADQRSGQLVGSSNLGEFEAHAVSLCHFADNEVVGSYAVPLEESDSWRQMDAGACYSPSDCWFGGRDGVAPNVGAFHLHWNGSAVTAVYEPEDHAVTSMASFKGMLYEAVQLEVSDLRSEGEAMPPAVIHTVASAGEQIFGNLTIVSQATKRLLPEYGKEVRPEALRGFDLETDAPAGATATQLWAAANPGQPPTSSKPATLTVLLDGAGGWSQALPGPSGETSLAGGSLAGSRIEAPGGGYQYGVGEAIAPEPGAEDAWLSLRGGAGADVALIEADGKIAQANFLPEAGEGGSGSAGPITCPASHDCWMATFAEPASGAGWLFHLSDGAPETPNTDPLFDGADGVIAYRPPDSGVPDIYTEQFAEDNSLANQKVIAAPGESLPKRPRKHVKRRKSRRLVKDIKSRLLDHRTLVIAFMLTGKAHVQLIARQHTQIVAETRRESLHPGRHTISLALNPRRWPTVLKFEAKPIGGSRSSSPGSQESSTSNVVGT